VFSICFLGKLGERTMNLFKFTQLDPAIMHELVGCAEHVERAHQYQVSMVSDALSSPVHSAS